MKSFFLHVYDCNFFTTLQERSSPAPFDLSPKRRRMFSENCTTADKEGKLFFHLACSQ